MAEILTLRIPTDALRKIIDDKPEIRAQLESFACEKIAEEIMRKATSADLKALTEQTTRNAMDTLNRSLRDPSKWPADLQAHIKSMVLEHLKAQRVAMIDEFRKELNAALVETVKSATESLKEKVEELTLSHREHLRTYARRDFVEIANEVRNGLSLDQVKAAE